MVAKNLSQYLGVRGATPVTSQTKAIPGRESEMIQGDGGGMLFPVTDKIRLQRILILGTTGGSYYVGEKKLTQDSLNWVAQKLRQEPDMVINTLVDVSQRGLAATQDTLMTILAMAASLGLEETAKAGEDKQFEYVRKKALNAVPVICRTGTHILTFTSLAIKLRGLGRGLKSAIGSWFQTKSADDLALQVVKYFNREGVTLRDLLRMSHVKPVNVTEKAIYHYITQGLKVGSELNNNLPNIIIGAELAKTADERDLVEHIKTYRLPMEAVPTEKRSKAAYAALLYQLGVTALIRNLGTLSQAGVIATGEWEAIEYAVSVLTNQEVLKKARVHPFNVLVAYLVYKQGHSMNGNTRWTPVPDVADALQKAFYLSFGAVEPTGQRIVVAVDRSGSMGGQVHMGKAASPSGLTDTMAAAAMAFVTYKVESRVYPLAFSAPGHTYGRVGQASKGYAPVDLSRLGTLEEAVKAFERSGIQGGTDLTMPIQYAIDNNLEVDAFVVGTDNESWAGKQHVVQAVQQYRKRTGINAKYVSVGYSASKATVVDSKDAGMLDVVGFSADSPRLISSFLKGEV